MKFVFHISFLFVTFVEEYNYNTRQDVILHVSVNNVLFRFGMNILLVLWHFLCIPESWSLNVHLVFDFMDLSGFYANILCWNMCYVMLCLMKQSYCYSMLLFALVNTHLTIVFINLIKFCIWLTFFITTVIIFSSHFIMKLVYDAVENVMNEYFLTCTVVRAVWSRSI